MNPEDGFRRLNDPDEWNVTLRARPDAVPARRRWAPWAVSLATIAAVAVFGALIFSIFGLGIQSVRNPVAPAVPSLTATPSPSQTAGAATPDDGTVLTSAFAKEFANDLGGAEDSVRIDGNSSVPWAISSISGQTLYIGYVACGHHLGVDVTENDRTVTITAVSSSVPDADCTSSPQLGAGAIRLEADLGSRTLMHAALSAPFATLPNPLETTEPIALIDHVGGATCANVIDNTTRADFTDQGLVDGSDGYAQNILVQPSLTLHDFIEYGGIVCEWGPPQEGTDIAIAFAFGPISAADAKKQQKRLGELDHSTRDGIDYFTSDSVGYAFADGYWATSLDNGGGDVLDEVIRNGLALQQASSDAAATPAKPPYLTTEGLDTLRIGQKVPASNDFVAWDGSVCDGGEGAWVPKKAYGGMTGSAITVITTDRKQNAGLYAIVLRDATIPTKSGIRVGDSEARLKATYPKLDQVSDYIYVVDGTAGKVAFQLIGGKVAAITLYTMATEPGEVMATDAWGTCGG